MATPVILPALGMAQETGKIVRWLKAEGEQVTKGEPLVEIETDKATVELEAPASGLLSAVTAAADDEVPVGHSIAEIRSEADAINRSLPQHTGYQQEADAVNRSLQKEGQKASPLASRIAAEHNLDLSRVTPTGKRIQKADVLTYLQTQETMATQHNGASVSAEPVARISETPVTSSPRLLMASPKARRLAREQGLELSALTGTGPNGAILSADVLSAKTPTDTVGADVSRPRPVDPSETLEVSNIWRIMAERTTQSWTSVPHFYLVREVNVSRLVAWREQVMKRSATKVTYTDLLVKIVASALRLHPRINATWNAGKISVKSDIHIGLAVAIEDGLVVPVIHQADTLSLAEIAERRIALVAKAQTGKLRPQDMSDGTFTISNLGMYNVDAFNAIINQPQAAILAVGRIAERIVPLHGQASIQPMMTLTLSCDHRALDGAHGAQFLDSIGSFVEEPLGLLA